MKYSLLHDNILIEPDKAQEKTASGILIHENWKDLPPLGTVVAVGPDVTQVKVGDRVLFHRYAVTQIKEHFQKEDEGYRLGREHHIMAIVHDEGETDA